MNNLDNVYAIRIKGTDVWFSGQMTSRFNAFETDKVKIYCKRNHATSARTYMSNHRNGFYLASKLLREGEELEVVEFSLSYVGTL